MCNADADAVQSPRPDPDTAGPVTDRCESRADHHATRPRFTTCSAVQALPASLTPASRASQTSRPRAPEAGPWIGSTAPESPCALHKSGRVVPSPGRGRATPAGPSPRGRSTAARPRRRSSLHATLHVISAERPYVTVTTHARPHLSHPTHPHHTTAFKSRRPSGLRRREMD